MQRFTIAYLAVSLLLVVLAEPSGAGELHPVLRAPVDAPISDPFRAPLGPYGPGNRGIEYATVPGQPVVAAAPGRVDFSGTVAGERVITIRHSGGYQTTYLGFLSIEVSNGELLLAGAVLGTAASRLHFGFKLRGAYLDPALAFGQQRTRVWLVSPQIRVSGPSIGDRIGGGIGRSVGVVAHTVVNARGLVVGVFVETASGVGWVVDRSGVLIGAGYREGQEVLQIPLELLENFHQLELLLPDGPIEQLQDLWNTFSEYRRSQRDCTSSSAAVPRVTGRRIAVFVPGLGSSSDDPEPFAGESLGYAEGDIVHFSYSGGAIPGTGENLAVSHEPYGADQTGQDIRLSAERLAELLRSVHEANPGVPVDVIAHSLGGLVARSAIQDVDVLPDSIENLVTLGTPHQGSPHAKTAILASRDAVQSAILDWVSLFPVDINSPSLRQLVPGSAFLENLAKGEMPPDVQLRSIGSRSDLIVPANMVGVGNHGELSIVSGVSHGELPGNSSVMREVGLALAGMPPTCRGMFDFFLDQSAGEAVEFVSGGLNIVQLEISLISQGPSALVR